MNIVDKCDLFDGIHKRANSNNDILIDLIAVDDEESDDGDETQPDDGKKLGEDDKDIEWEKPEDDEAEEFADACSDENIMVNEEMDELNNLNSNTSSTKDDGMENAEEAQEPGDDLSVHVILRGNEKDAEEGTRDFLDELFNADGSQSPDNSDSRQTSISTFNRGIPLGPDESWDFSLQAFNKRTSNKSKCMWIEGPFYQKLKAECYHEMINVTCACEEQKRVAKCRLCHQVFCSNQCFKKTREQITGPSSSSITSSVSADESQQKVTTSSAKSYDADSENNTESEEVGSGDIPPAPAQPEVEKLILKEQKDKVRSENEPKSESEINKLPFSKQNHGQNQKYFNHKSRFQSQQDRRTIFNSPMPDTPPKGLWPPHVQRQVSPQAQSSNLHPKSLVRDPKGLSNQDPSSPASVSQNESPQSYVPNQSGSGLRSSPLLNGEIGVSEGQQILNLVNKKNEQPIYGQGPTPFEKTSSVSSSPSSYNSAVTSITSPIRETHDSLTPITKEPTVKICRNPGPVRAQASEQHNNVFPVNATHGQNLPKPHFVPVIDVHHPTPMTYPNPYNKNYERRAQDKPAFPPNAPIPRHQEFNTNFARNINARAFGRGKQNRQHQNHRTHSQGRGYGKSHFYDLREENSSHSSSTSNSSATRGNSPYENDQDKFKGSNSLQARNYKAHQTDMNQVTTYNSTKNQAGAGKCNRQNSQEDHNTDVEKPFQRHQEHIGNQQLQRPHPESGGDAIAKIFDKIQSKPSTLSSSKRYIFPSPDIPVGVILPVTYMWGDSLNDFSVMTSKNREVFKQIQKRLQSCDKKTINVIERKDWCMVKYRLDQEDENSYEWYRGVFTEVLNSIRVYLFDIGQIVSVRRTDVCQLPQDLRSRPLLIRMRAHNIKYGSEEEEIEAKEQFQSFIRENLLKIQITHEDSDSEVWCKKYAGKVLIKHINKWCDVVDYLQKMLIGSKRSEEEIRSDRKLIPLQTTSDNQIFSSLSGPRREYLGSISSVESLNEIYFATKEMIRKKRQIESQLNRDDMKAKLTSMVANLGDLSCGYFAIPDDDELQIIRVTVLEMTDTNDPMSAIVFCLDSGIIRKVPIESLVILPEELKSPSTVIKCSLPVKPGGRQEDAVAALRERIDQRAYLVPLLESPANNSDSSTLVELFFEEDSDEGFTSMLLKKKEGFQLFKNVDLTRPRRKSISGRN